MGAVAEQQQTIAVEEQQNNEQLLYVAHMNLAYQAYARGDFALTILRPAQTYNDTSTPLPLLGPGTHFMRRVRQGKPVVASVLSHSDFIVPSEEGLGSQILCDLGVGKIHLMGAPIKYNAISGVDREVLEFVDPEP